MNKNPNIADFNRAFVVVGPDSTICEAFTLRDAPNPEEFSDDGELLRPKPIRETIKSLKFIEQFITSHQRTI